MEYKKIINLLENSNNPLSKFRIKNWFQVNDDVPRINSVVKTNSQINFKTTILKSSLCDYSAAYVIVMV